jgi:Domain of unknown function (DUF4389)
VPGVNTASHVRIDKALVAGEDTGYYSYSALGTDRYPPFTLSELPDYPARLSVVYPQSLSRGLVLAKWWLLTFPHYLITGVFTGGAFAGYEQANHGDVWLYGNGLIGLLVCIAGIALLFADRYPRGLYEFVMGMNRWVFRVVAYAALMTDRYAVPPGRGRPRGAARGRRRAGRTKRRPGRLTSAESPAN